MKNYNDEEQEQEYQPNYQFLAQPEEPEAPNDDSTPITKRRKRKRVSFLPMILALVLGSGVGLGISYVMKNGIPGSVQWSYSFGGAETPDPDGDSGFGFHFDSGDVETIEEASSQYSLPSYKGDSSDLTVTLYQPSESGSSEELSPTDLYQQERSATVSITVYAGQSAGYGSGMIIREDGYVLTCAHVIEDTEECTVTLSDGTRYDAKLVGSDEQTDLAVLKIDAEELNAVTFCDSDSLEIGEATYAIGDPLGPQFAGSFTNGILSGVDRTVSASRYSMSLLQTTAAVNSGNSGGALFNRFGQVIGVVNMKMSSSTGGASIDNMGLAISSTTVKKIVEELAVKGTVSRAVLGITCYTMEEATAHVSGVPQGLWIVTINEKSDCAAQGLLVGDLITAANGQPVHSVPQFQSVIADCKAGDTVTLTVWRDEALAEQARENLSKGDSSEEIPDESAEGSLDTGDASASAEPVEYHFEELGDITVKLVSSEDIQ